MDKTGKVTEAQSQGYRWDADEAVKHEAGQLGQGRGGYSQSSAGRGAQEGGWGAYSGQAHVDEDALVVQTDSGGQVSVENRARWFAQEQDFSAQVGDQVTLAGFYYEEDDFEVGQIDDATNGQTVLLRDENRRPPWDGCGRRGS